MIGHRGRQGLVHRPRACGWTREEREREGNMAELQTDRNDAVITAAAVRALGQKSPLQGGGNETRARRDHVKERRRGRGGKMGER